MSNAQIKVTFRPNRPAFDRFMVDGICGATPAEAYAESLACNGVHIDTALESAHFATYRLYSERYDQPLTESELADVPKYEG